MPQETKQKFEAVSSYSQGAAIAAAQPEELKRALDGALDYRGDITLELKDGRRVEGYLFDRREGKGLDDSTVRLIPTASTSQSGEEKLTVRYSEIAGLTFSGRDNAAGKTWENWVRRYAEKKLKGEHASIESEKLD